MGRRGVIVPAAGLAGVMIAESGRKAATRRGLGRAWWGCRGVRAAAAVGIAKGAAVMAKATAAKTAAAVICILLILGIGTGVIIKWMAGANEKTIAVSSTNGAATIAPASEAAATEPEVPTKVVLLEGAEADKQLDAALDVIAKQQKAVRNLAATGLPSGEYLNDKSGLWEFQEEQGVTVTYGEPATVVEEPFSSWTECPSPTASPARKSAASNAGSPNRYTLAKAARFRFKNTPKCMTAACP